MQKLIDPKESRFALTHTLLDYWNERRGENLAPSWSEIDLMDLPFSFIPHIVVVDCERETSDFRYRFWGTWHITFHGYDQTNKLVSELQPPQYGKLMIDQYRQTLEARRPLLFVQQIPIKNGRWATTELMRLPLSQDGRSITNILSAELSNGDARDARNYFTGNADATALRPGVLH